MTSSLLRHFQHVKSEMAALTLLLLLVAVSSASSARIAGFVAFGGSQYMNLRHTLEELASRGHEVGTSHTFIFVASNE